MLERFFHARILSYSDECCVYDFQFPIFKHTYAFQIITPPSMDHTLLGYLVMFCFGNLSMQELACV
jgi:hypothetical protein